MQRLAPCMLWKNEMPNGRLRARLPRGGPAQCAHETLSDRLSVPMPQFLSASRQGPESKQPCMGQALGLCMAMPCSRYGPSGCRPADCDAGELGVMSPAPDRGLLAQGYISSFQRKPGESATPAAVQPDLHSKIPKQAPSGASQPAHLRQEA